MVNFLKLYTISFLIFFLIDMAWLGLIAKNIYQKYIGHLMKANPNWIAAIFFYLFFIFGMIIFVIYPAIKNNSWAYAFMYGAMFGFFTYMTFNLTNLSVLQGWKWQVAIIDISWGIVISSSVSLISYFIYKNFL